MMEWSCTPGDESRFGSPEEVLYLDNAATSWPKPPGVAAAVLDYMERVGANPGRAGHGRAAEAGRLVHDARRAVAGLFGVARPVNVVFGPNATWGLNQVIDGLLRQGDHAITTSLEHNSVLRPLKRLELEGRISLTVVPAGAEGRVDPERVLAEVVPGRTALVVVTAASNVCGTVQPVAEIGRGCRARGVAFLVDAAQAGGAVDLDLDRDSIDLLAFAGHKGLMGPTGTGGLVLADGFPAERLRPLVAGGTGSLSDSTLQPSFLPDALESGTLNVAGLAGLAAGIGWLGEEGGGAAAVGRHEAGLRKRFVASASAAVPGFRVLGSRDGPAVGVVSFTVAGWTSSDLGQALSERYGILGRQGLHCAPLAHRTLGSFPEGAMRFGFGPFNKAGDADRAVAALTELVLARGPS